MSNHLGITLVATGQVSNGVDAINTALGVHDAAIWTSLDWSLSVALSDEATTAITTGTAKLTVYAETAVTLTDCFIGLSTQSSSGAVTVNVKKNGTTIFSTNPSIDANEDTSLTGTAAVLSGTQTLARGDKLTFDITAAGTGAKGLKVFLTGRRT